MQRMKAVPVSPSLRFSEPEGRGGGGSGFGGMVDTSKQEFGYLFRKPLHQPYREPEMQGFSGKPKVNWERRKSFIPDTQRKREQREDSRRRRGWPGAAQVMKDLLRGELVDEPWMDTPPAGAGWVYHPCGADAGYPAKYNAHWALCGGLSNWLLEANDGAIKYDYAGAPPGIGQVYKWVYFQPEVPPISGVMDAYYEMAAPDADIRFNVPVNRPLNYREPWEYPKTRTRPMIAVRAYNKTSPELNEDARYKDAPYARPALEYDFKRDGRDPPKWTRHKDVPDRRKKVRDVPWPLVAALKVFHAATEVDDFSKVMCKALGGVRARRSGLGKGTRPDCSGNVADRLLVVAQNWDAYFTDPSVFGAAIAGLIANHFEDKVAAALFGSHWRGMPGPSDRPGSQSAWHGSVYGGGRGYDDGGGGWSPWDVSGDVQEAGRSAGAVAGKFMESF